MNNSLWSRFPEKQPSGDGYYMTLYYNFDQQSDLYKAIWWSNDKKKWVGWRSNDLPDVSKVKGFVESTRNDYYVPCVIYSSENIKEPFRVE